MLQLKFKVLISLVLIKFYDQISGAINTEKVELWQKLISESKSWASNLEIKNAHNLEYLIRSANISQKCRSSSLKTLDEIRNLRDWAVECK
jgi:hypothetical protein